MNKHQREVAILTNEICACGHLRGLHFDNLQGLAKGHGACSLNKCECPRYTWAKFIDSELAKSMTL